MVAYAVRPAGLGRSVREGSSTPGAASLASKVGGSLISRVSAEVVKTTARAAGATTSTAATAADSAIISAANTLDQCIAQMQSRTQGGSIVELDGKTPCPTGPWSDNVGVGKDHETDPNHCLSYGGPWLTPMLELPVDCADAGQLLWADIGDRARAALQTLMRNKPTASTPGEVQFRWYKGVLSACTIMGLALNISPRMFTVGTTPSAGDQYPWGKYEVFQRALKKQDVLHNAVQTQVERMAGAARAGQFSAVPVVCPSFVATSDEFARMEDRRPYTGPQEQVGWNDDYTYADSLYRKLLACETASIFGFDGFRGTNVGQSTMWLGTPELYERLDASKRDKRIPTGHDGTPRAPGFYGRGFAFPYAMLAAGSATNTDVADQSTRAFLSRSADDRMRALFVTTGSKTSHLEQGFFRSRTYWVGGAPPHPARSHDHWQRCWAPTAKYYVDMAETWGQAFLEIDFAERVSSCLLAYTYRIKRVLRALADAGYPTDSGVAGALASIEDVAQKIRLETGAGALRDIGAVASTILSIGAAFGGNGGIIGLVIAVVLIVVAFLVVAFIEIAYWNRSPRAAIGNEKWSLMLDSFFLRTPPIDSGCAANPEAGVDLLDKGFSDERGYGAPFARIAQGMSPFTPPPPAQDTSSEFPWKTLLLAGGALALLAVATRSK